MATINLGSIKFNWKGAYNGATAYAVDDVVSSGGSSYVCILASTGNATSNGTYWELMSSAGTNGTDGTDVGTTLTTQGDILYRDGSGLQRLAKGTAGQVLQMNSGATAPEYADASGGDWVKLHTTNISSSTGTVSIDGHFDDDTYNYYHLAIKNLSTSNDSSNSVVFFGLNSSGSYNNSAEYYATGFTSASDSSGGGNVGNHRTWGDTKWSFTQNNQDGEVTANSFGFVELFNPTIYNRGTNMMSTCFSHHANSSNHYSNFCHGWRSSAQANTGISFFPSGGNIDSGSFILYGIKL